MQLLRASQIATVVIAIILAFAALDATESIFAPLLLAIVTGIVLSPLFDLWERIRLRPAMGALAAVFVVVIVMATLAVLLQPIVGQLVEQAPKVMSDLQGAIDTVRDIGRGLKEASDEVTQAMAVDTATATGAAPPADAAAPETQMLPSVADAILLAPAILGQFLIFAGALFFFLLTRQDIYAWVSPRISVRAPPVQIAARLRRAERLVSRYFLTVTVINAGLGALTGVSLQVMGLPNAMLWGVVAALLNYIVYLGAAVVTIGLLFAGIAAFDGAMALAPATVFVLLNSIEGQFVTPSFVGKQTEVNPLLVFVALIFGFWLWGPIGGFVALPLVIWILVLMDPQTLNLAEFAAEPETPPLTPPDTA